MAAVNLRLLGFLVTLLLSARPSKGQEWPDGTYGLPKPKTGCPVSLAFRWNTGWRYQDTEDKNASNQKSKSFHQDAVVQKNDVNRTFCVKTASHGVKTDWPRGKYCIYKKGACPVGLKEGFIFWDDENNKNINERSGTLPDGLYNKDTRINYCCRTDGDKMKPIILPVGSPFYLLAYNSSECQRVKGAVARKEFIRFDNEDTGNKDKCNGTFPYGGGVANHNISYCYYENCNYTLSLDGRSEIQFASPLYSGDGYPLYQTCSWRLVVPKGKTLNVKFLEFQLQNEDEVAIHSGWNELSGTLVVIKKQPPSDSGYLSQSNVLYLVFKSSSSRKSQGFRAKFEINKATDTKGAVWPSGTYGLPQARIGCPKLVGGQWKQGWRYQDTEDNNASNLFSTSFHLFAQVADSAVNMTFCLKTDEVSKKPKKKVEWPKGKYCIYKKGACPNELDEGYIFWDDENDKNINEKGGTLPDGVYNENTKIYFCCRTDGDQINAITLPVTVPFYLLAYNSSACQSVQGALATAEFIGYDDEDTRNQDTRNGSYPYGGGTENPRITYCYYEVCHTAISGENQTFRSSGFLDGGFPNSQRCSWRFMVEEDKGRQIVIKFVEFDLQKGSDNDKVKIYGGWDETSPVLTEFSGDHPPSGQEFAFKETTVFLVFTSDSTGRSKGFTGVFMDRAYNKSAVLKHPITLPPTTTKKPSATSKNATRPVTSNAAVPSQGKRNQAGGASLVAIVIPVIIAAVIVAVLITIYCIRRRRRRTLNRLRKLETDREQMITVTNSSYGNLDSQEYEYSDELQDIFPTT